MVVPTATAVLQERRQCRIRSVTAISQRLLRVTAEALFPPLQKPVQKPVFDANNCSYRAKSFILTATLDAIDLPHLSPKELPQTVYGWKETQKVRQCSTKLRESGFWS